VNLQHVGFIDVKALNVVQIFALDGGLWMLEGIEVGAIVQLGDGPASPGHINGCGANGFNGVLEI